MPNALTMRPGAGRKAAPPKRPTRGAATPSKETTQRYDAQAVHDADTLGGDARDVAKERRGPPWLRERLGGEPDAGGTKRVTVF